VTLNDIGAVVHCQAVGGHIMRLIQELSKLFIVYLKLSELSLALFIDVPYIVYFLREPSVLILKGIGDDLALKDILEERMLVHLLVFQDEPDLIVVVVILLELLRVELLLLCPREPPLIRQNQRSRLAEGRKVPLIHRRIARRSKSLSVDEVVSELFILMHLLEFLIGHSTVFHFILCIQILLEEDDHSIPI